MQVKVRDGTNPADSMARVIRRQTDYRATLLSLHEAFFRYLHFKGSSYSAMTEKQQQAYIEELKGKFRPLHEECSGCGRKDTDTKDHLHTLVALNAIAGQGLRHLRLNRDELCLEYQTHHDPAIWKELQDSKDILRVGGCKVESILLGKPGRARQLGRVTKPKIAPKKKGN